MTPEPHPLIRVLLVDDHPVFAAGLRGLLGAEPELQCVGVATTAAEAVDRSALLRPDVVVMDLHLPDGDGVATTRRILSAQPGIGVLILTMHAEESLVVDAMRAGARGYVLKGADEDDIVRAVTAVGRGEAILGRAVAERLLEQFTALPDAAARAFPDLTGREREILELLADGGSNGQIALRLDLSPKTVRNHVSNICNKLQVLDCAQAALAGRDAGLGTVRRA